MSFEHTSKQLINQQIQQLDELSQLLTQEKEILQHHKPNDLIQITQTKNDLLLAIKALDDVISENTTFTQDKAEGKLKDDFAALEEKLNQCKLQNEVNGKIIQQSQLAVERMKTTLLESHNRSSITYDGKGKKNSGLRSLDLKA